MKPFFYLTLWIAAAVLPAAADITVKIENRASPTESETSVALTNGGFDHRGTRATEATADNGGRLREVVIGASFASGAPDYAFGDEISPPEGNWDPRPVQAGDNFLTTGALPAQFVLPFTGTVNYYYSPHSGKVFASHPGAVTIFWRSASPNSQGQFTVTRTYHIVTIVPKEEPKRLFWNVDAGSSGPAVTLPAVVEDVVFAYGTADFTIPADDSNTNSNHPVYLENASSSRSLKAHLQEGRIFMEFLGVVVDGQTARRVALGHAVVDIMEEPVLGITAFEKETFLGEQLVPSDGDPLLVSEVEDGLAASPPYIANRSTNTQPAYFGERLTANDDGSRNANKVRIFWRETDAVGIQWPKFRDSYHLIWPDENLPGNFAINALPDNGLEEGTYVDLNSANTPIQVYPTPGDSAAVIDDLGHFTVPPGSAPEKTLLLLNSGGRYWYVRVYSATQSHLATLPAELKTTFTTVVHVGDRLIPPPGLWPDLSRAGHIHTPGGTSYHPGAYVDPMSAGFGEAELRSEIIPVNSLPGNDRLTVWWYRKLTPPAAGFQPIYWPSVVATCKIAYPGGGVASQSSDSSTGHPAAAAVDGQNGADNFSQTADDDADPWWTLDYAVETIFKSVEITNTTSNKGRLRDITVEVLDEAGVVLWASALLNPGNAENGPRALTVSNINTTGRTLRIRRDSDPGSAGADANVLAMEEVTVQAESDFAPREIIMASNAGTGTLTAEESAGSIYTQNHDDLPGYNPNEEHALMLGGQGYALRDDLNLPLESSAPYVLVDYVKPDGRHALSVFHVLREKGEITFEYAADAGKPLQGPAPLPLLPLPLFANESNANREIIDPAAGDPDADTSTDSLADRFVFVDRKGTSWIYRGPHNGSTTARVRMEYYYKTQPGFYFPSLADNRQPAIGTITPYLRQGTPGAYTGDPVTGLTTVGFAQETKAQVISYRPQWPAAPMLQFGETLTNAKAGGLPQIRGQSSIQILYEQSRARDSGSAVQSVALIDPTRAKTYLLGTGSPPLDSLPSDIATDSRNGKTYFQKLPPHLKERFYFNPLLGSKGGLVLEGKFVNDIVGEDYLLLNVLSDADLDTITDLSDSSGWSDAVRNLTTTVETFAETREGTPDRAGSGIFEPAANPDTYSSDELPVITSPDQAVDSYALTPLGTGQGYVTLVFGNGKAFTPEDEPVSMEIIQVGPELYTGQTKVLASANPLDEKVTLRHSADFAARPQDYEFEWMYAPPANGRVVSLQDLQGASAGDPPDGYPDKWLRVTTPPTLSNTQVVGGSGILALSDNYWIMRYKPIAPGHPARNQWSPWTSPALVEGWIKRALAGINPFSQRITDFFNNGVNTDVSILTQAGKRWEGNIALNLDSINEFGLIEIYETILQRGIGLSINGTPPTDYGPANDALLLAAGYLADLYTILGDEASADAANPTIAFDAAAIGSVAQSSVAADFESVFRQTATARFAFQGQVGSLLEEELSLLRGRDDVNSPGVELAPAYNRMYWNYTRGITAGEVIYALNYNIRERQEATADGKIDATDAYRMFPQAHGDAYGHYLTATKNYYRLLTDPQFTWAPRIEAVNILGVPVQVDYLDERKFAAAAARTAKAAKQIAGLVHRQVYSADTAGGWQHFRDGTNPNVNYRDGKATSYNTDNSPKRVRHWGLDEWNARGAQGAYFNWVVANAILPASSTATGIEKIDRTTVPELDELSLIAADLQHTADSAHARLSPLGLEAGSTLFDISPTELAAGKSHFEQVYERATRALGNAFDTFDQATASTRLLRSLENQADDLSAAVFDQERAYSLQLIELFGTPYAGDIGPGKVYAQGYDGPDLFRFFYVDQSTRLTDGFNAGAPFSATLRFPVWNSLTREWITTDPAEAEPFPTPRPATAAEQDSGDLPYDAYTTMEYEVRPESLVQYATPEMGQRLRPGRIQTALQTLGARRETLFAALYDYQRADEAFEQKVIAFNDQITAYLEQQTINETNRDTIDSLRRTAAGFRTASRFLQQVDDLARSLTAFWVDGLPTGLDDPSAVLRQNALGAYFGSQIVTNTAIHSLDTKADYLEQDIEKEASDLARKLDAAQLPAEIARMGAELQEDLYFWWAATSGIDQAMTNVETSRMELAGLLHDAGNIQRSREIFRKRAAAITQGYRTRDVAFRTFRTEALETYQTLLDWAARYALLAAKAYDYETGLLGTPTGRKFLSDIVGSRALGLRNAAGQPIFAASSTGDPGISGLLAKLNGDWSSVNTRLGFNNPDTYGTVFSFRQENYRIPGDTAPTDADTDANNDSQDDKTWKEQMQSLIVSDIRTDADVATHCLQLSSATAPVPGFIIPFSTMVQDGYNFFGQPLAAGDSAFSSTSFATKIHSVGIVFDGYVGMNAYATGSPTAAGPASNAPNALSATPYVFLIPTGMDVMRTPPLGDSSITREFAVQDYALPLPFNIGDSQFSNISFWTGNDTLTENFLTPRKHQAFRAVDHPFYFFTPLTADFSNHRLVGRSVWNTGWKLVIPASTLLNNTSDGLSRFLRSVKDIKFYVRSYSYSGN